jgi:anthranilate synthase/aminodeoxychorismate synthase-like glutamine amidotransferase
MVFVLDNYDSFTYNLVQYIGELGAEVTVRRNDQVTVAEIDALHPDRIVISPGPCTPQEAGISIDVIRQFAGRFRCWAFASGIRLLAQPSAAKWFARRT